MYLERFRLDDRVAVVTGGGRGIGFAIAEALGEAGATVVVTDLDGESAELAARKLAERGYRVEAEQEDVTDSSSVDACCERIVGRHGRVDVLVNNAGIARSNIKAEEMSDEDWLAVVDVNLNGVFWNCRTFGRAMLEAGRGSIVNVGSMSGFIVNRPQEQAQYNASKSGVHHLTRSLAAEWADRGLRVNAVAPTYIETELLTTYMTEQPETVARWLESTPMNRMGQPDEIASVVLFLASDASSLMTGSIVLADGGYSCW